MRPHVNPLFAIRFALVGAAVVFAAAITPKPAFADDDDAEQQEEAGHVSFTGGALVGDDSGSLAVSPLVRAEVAFNLIGPFAAGGFLQAAFRDQGDIAPAFGGGVLLTLRPDVPALGFVPHIEITGARLQLPTRAEAGIIDAWSAGIGAGAGFHLAEGVSLECRVHHGWYFGMPMAHTLAESAWTFGAALNVDLS
jgi:hypothetical protein